MIETTSQPRFFHGIEPRMWTPNRLYRVYVRPTELIFIRAGSAGDLSTAALAPHFGLIGALLAAATDPAKKNQKLQEEMKSANPEDLIDSHNYNFRASVDEIWEASLDPPSLGIAMLYNQPHHRGVFRFNHPDRGTVKVAISSIEEMQTAFEILPYVLGERLAVNVNWNERKQNFGRKR